MQQQLVCRQDNEQLTAWPNATDVAITAGDLLNDPSFSTVTLALVQTKSCTITVGRPGALTKLRVIADTKLESTALFIIYGARVNNCLNRWRLQLFCTVLFHKRGQLLSALRRYLPSHARTGGGAMTRCPVRRRPQKISFGTFVVRPAFEMLAKLVPDQGHFLSRMDATQAMWQEIARQGQEAEGGEGGPAGEVSVRVGGGTERKGGSSGVGAPTPDGGKRRSSRSSGTRAPRLSFAGLLGGGGAGTGAGGGGGGLSSRPWAPFSAAGTAGCRRPGRRRARRCRRGRSAPTKKRRRKEVDDGGGGAAAAGGV